MNNKSLSLWFNSPGKVEIKEEVLIKEDGKILFNSSLMGISAGTEMLFFDGKINLGIDADSSIDALSTRIQYPMKYGYINAGFLENGKKAFAFYPHSTKFYINSKDLLILPEDIDFNDAIFIPNMETALNIVQDSEIIFGETVCVFGLGVVGLLICEILKLNGVKKIIAIDPSSFKREKSKNFGCQSLYFENNEKLISEIYKLTENRGVDIAINVSGSSLALQNAINILAFSGTLIEGSWYGNKNVCLNLGTNFHRKRLKIKSSQVSTINPDLTGRWDKKRRFNLVFELLREIKPSKYITHTFKLIDGQKCFDFIKYNKDLIIQVALQP